MSDPLDASHNRQESFHPNAAGNSDMTAMVMQKLGGVNLANYDLCPNSDANNCPDSTATESTIDVPQYFKDVETINAHYTQMTQFDNFVNGTMDVVSSAFSFADSALVTFTLHSDPVQLGQFTAAADGSLNAKIAIPSTVPAGIHTLIVSGLSRSGEPIEYEQTVLIKSSDPNDADADGIVDSQDRCLFIPASNKDQDSDNIDDACDPEIGTAQPTTTPILVSLSNIVTTIVQQLLIAFVSFVKMSIGLLLKIIR